MVIQMDGKEEFQCKHCDTKYGNQKSIKTHVTVKHRKEKSVQKAPSEGGGSTPSVGGDEGSYANSNGFDFEGVPSSTQVTNESVDEILKKYEEEETEEVSGSVSEIPDDTVDEIMASIDEPVITETTSNEHETQRQSDDSSNPLEEENKTLKDSIESYKAKLIESEETSLNAQLEISSLTEKIHQLENIIQTKDDQNSLLLGEKNSLEMKHCEVEARVSKINKAITKIHNEKEALKVQIVEQETTIVVLQSKSPATPSIDNNPTSAAVKKLNDSLKSKTGAITDLKNRNKQLADELAEMQNTVNNMNDNVKDNDSDKCSKLTKVVNNKSKKSLI